MGCGETRGANTSHAEAVKIAAESGSENSHPEYAKIGVARPSMDVASRVARKGMPTL